MQDEKLETATPQKIYYKSRGFVEALHKHPGSTLGTVT
jgi:hypothetical protein